MPVLRLLLAALALVRLLASVFVHVCALRGVDATAAWPQLWALHAGIFVVFLPFVLMVRKTFGRRPALGLLWSAVPRWLGIAGAALLLYAALNFALALGTLRQGSPVERDGHYELQDHGRFVREIDAAQYQAVKATEARLFSGHWMVFYFLPFAFFAFTAAPGARQEPRS